MNKEWVEQKILKLQAESDKIVHDFFDRIRSMDLLEDGEKSAIIQKVTEMREYRPYLSMMFCMVATEGLNETPSMEYAKKFFAIRSLCKELDIEKSYQLLCEKDYVARLVDSEPVQFDGDIIITDPCYVVKDGDWTLCEYGNAMDKIGLEHCMVRDTLYGDWSCSVFDSKSMKKIGSFCADAGLVGVFDLKELLQYDPEYRDHIDNSYAAALIKDFCGTIQFVVKPCSEDDDVDEGDEDYYVSVVGHGVNKKTGEEVNFFTAQTGF